MDDLKKLLEKMDEKLDKVSTDITDIKVVQSAQASDLKHHIFRTDLAERHITALEAGIKPIEKHVSQLNGVLKLLGIIGIFAGIAKAGIEIFRMF